MRKKITSLLICLLLATTFAGCTKVKATITTTVYPVRYLVEKLAGNKVDVQYISEETFIQRSRIADNYKELLEKTDLLIYVGELEPYMDLFQEEMQTYSFSIINLASLSAVYNFRRYKIAKINGVSVTTESEYYDSPLFDLTDKYNMDPFIWMDPISMSSMALTIKEWLQQRYPEESLVFENNFKALQAELVRMDAEYRQLLNYSNIKLVTVAPTFGCWQKVYGVQVYPLIMSRFGVLPTEEQLEVIKKQIVADGVKYIVYDPTLPEDMQALYQQVRDELKLKEITLSSLSILSEADKEKSKDYKTIMYENLTTLENAFK